MQQLLHELRGRRCTAAMLAGRLLQDFLGAERLEPLLEAQLVLQGLLVGGLVCEWGGV